MYTGVPPNAVFVTSEWLTESLRLGTAQDEAQFAPPMQAEPLHAVPELHPRA